MKLTWEEAVRAAVHRFYKRHNRDDFYRQELIDQELPQIVEDTRSRGKTPEQTLTWTLERLRDRKEIKFIDYQGHYRLIR